MDSASDLEESLKAIIRRVVDEALEERQAASEMLDQYSSLVGNRQHINAAKALIKAGDPRAVVVGRRYLVERSALLEKLREEVEPQEPQSLEEDHEDADAFLEAHGLRRNTEDE